MSRDLTSSPRPSRRFRGRVLLSGEQARCGRLCPCPSVWDSPRLHGSREQGPRLPGTVEKCPTAPRGFRTSKIPCYTHRLSVHPAQSKPHTPPHLTPLPHTHRGHLAQDLRGLRDPETPSPFLLVTSLALNQRPSASSMPSVASETRQGPSVRPWHLAAFCQNPGHSMPRAQWGQGLTPESWAALPAGERRPAGRRRCLTAGLFG